MNLRLPLPCLLLAACLPAPFARAAGPAEAPLAREVRGFIQGSTPTSALRVEVAVGQLDPRLRLAPCQKMQPYLPAGSRLWGATRIGLRCTQGIKPWNVSLPVVVRVYGPALVATGALRAGHVLTDADLRTAEVDLTADRSQALPADPAPLLGRSLARPMSAGQALRENHLKARQWFAAGDIVRIRARGRGFAVGGSGQALTAGIEGQAARVRTESGRLVTGNPVSDGVLELVL